MADPQHLAQLQAGPSVWNQWRQDHPRIPIDLSHASLRRQDLSGIDLSEANLAHADLRGATLRQANLRHANLCYVNGRDAQVQQTSLEGAIAWESDFRGASLRGSSLVNADFRDTNFGEADLINTNASHAYLSGVNLEGAYAIGTLFRGTNLRWANLREANLKQANLTDAYLRWGNCYGTNFYQSILAHADVSEGNFAEANLTHSNLQGIQALGTNFQRAKFTAACIEHWRINSDTRFDQGVCDYIFLQEGDRFPQRGQLSGLAFESLMQRTLATVKLSFSNGLNWYAFAQAIRRTDTQNPEAQISIQDISHTIHQGVSVLIRTAPQANHDKIYHDFMISYERALNLSRAVQARRRSPNADRPDQLLDHVLTVSKHLSHSHIQHGRPRRSPPDLP
ncbi:MAG: pentapeptide repeat-containing protein [Elainellaceae cyanobacterium]